MPAGTARLAEFSLQNRKAAEDTLRELGFSQIHWIECGSVITTHGGTGCFGLSGFGKKREKEQTGSGAGT